jgi:hypothetical protein
VKHFHAVSAGNTHECSLKLRIGIVCNKEKQQGTRTDLTSYDNYNKSTSAQKLAKEYHVSTPTIIADGHVARAVDTLEAQVRADIRDTVLKRHERGKQHATKKQVTRVGHLVHAEHVKPMPFMPPLSAEEYQQLQANVLAEGCREPLVVWEEAGLLLDGHNREQICRAHALTFHTHLLSLPTREDAVNWIINNQIGRRNLTPEQKSYLRGKRFNEAKKAAGRPGKLPHNEGVSGPTSKRLAAEYHVAPTTIERDGQFATAVDTLDAQVRADIRETVLARHARGKQQPTKKQVTHVGQLVQEEKVKPMPFMQRPGWKPYQVLQAIEILGTLPHEDHAIIWSDSGLPPGAWSGLLRQPRRFAPIFPASGRVARWQMWQSAPFLRLPTMLDCPSS